MEQSAMPTNSLSNHHDETKINFAAAEGLIGFELTNVN